MKLFLLTQKEIDEHQICDACVVVAENENSAKILCQNIIPNWDNSEHFKIIYLGEARPDLELKDLICVSMINN